MKSIFGKFGRLVNTQPLNSRFHLAESPSCKPNFTKARLSDSNDGDLIILILRGNFFSFFSRSSSVDMPPAWLSRTRTECHRLFLVCLGKSRLFEVPRKVELGRSSVVEGKNDMAFSATEDSAADYLPLYEMRRETSWKLLASPTAGSSP